MASAVSRGNVRKHENPDSVILSNGQQKQADVKSCVMEMNTTAQLEKIRWSARLRPELLERLYRSDAMGFQDETLCDDVGLRLYTRCRTFILVARGEVECPRCRSEFRVEQCDKATSCPLAGCGWQTTWQEYWKSISNHSAWHGRALDAFFTFYDRYQGVSSYQEKILLIDALIHSFHKDEKKGTLTKSVASKLLEGNKHDVVQFLDRLSARDPDEKDTWRQIVASTIDARMLDKS